MTMKQIIIGAVIVIVLAAFAGACLDKQPAESEEIKIGAILPLTGDAASWGEMGKQGIDLAVDEINSEGGIKGKKIKVVYEDTQADPQKGVSAMRKLVSIDKVPVVIGDIVSAVVLAAAPIANENKVVLISPTASAPAVTDAGEYVFRNWPSDVFEGEFMARSAYNELGLKQVAILYINNDYGIGLREVFTETFEQLGGEILAAESYDADATDFRTQLTKIKATTPQTVYLISYYKDGALILKQATEMGLETQYLAASAIEDPKLIEIAGPATEGLIYPLSSGYDPESHEENIQEFKREFTARYGEEPSYVAAQAYDAMKIVAFSIEQGGTEGSGIQAAMTNVKDFSGVTGETTFDENGDVIKPMAIKTVKNGEFVLYS